MERDSKNSSARILRETVLEFLEVAITMVVYLKGVYPSEAFERRHYLNISVQRARHPQLRDYIHSALSSLHPFIQKDMVERVAVIFSEKNQVPVEKFIFKLKVNHSFQSTFPVNDIEYTLRTFLTKLTVSEPILQPLSEDCRWEIVAYFKQLPGDCSDSCHFWLPTDTKHWEQPPLITPIKSMNSEPLNMQLYVENCCDKHEKA